MVEAVRRACCGCGRRQAGWQAGAAPMHAPCRMVQAMQGAGGPNDECGGPGLAVVGRRAAAAQVHGDASWWAQKCLRHRRHERGGGQCLFQSTCVAA